MIALADNPLQEVDRLMAQTYAQAFRDGMSRLESDAWWIGPFKVRCVVVRKPVRGKMTYVRRLTVDGKACGHNDLCWQLRRWQGSHRCS